MIFTVDKRYATHVDRTPRVLEVAEAFGLGLDDKEFVVFDKQDFEIQQGDVVYVTGQSGSGKSTVLRELETKMTETGHVVANINGIELPERPVVELLGKDTNEANRLLTKAGLTDAYLWLRRPSELSDGQRYRLLIAKMIESQADVWVADEFMAVLDRVTAKALAFNIQQLARQQNVTLLVATTHTDMVDDLAPTLIVEKKFSKQIKIVRPEASFNTIGEEYAA